MNDSWDGYHEWNLSSRDFDSLEIPVDYWGHAIFLRNLKELQQYDHVHVVDRSCSMRDIFFFR